jgi:hypothetical protein
MRHHGILSIFCSACLFLLAGVSCGHGSKGVKSASGGAFQAVHLVKINVQSEEFVVKGFFEGSARSYVIQAENEIGMSVFTVTWDGKKLAIRPAGKMVAGMIPFDLRNIAVDIWRITSEWKSADIRDYNKNNDPDLPEDTVVVEVENESVAVKKLAKGDQPVAEIRYYPSGGAGADSFRGASTIRFKDEILDYEITILQKML